jgi:hypothetical protein
LALLHHIPSWSINDVKCFEKEGEDSEERKTKWNRSGSFRDGHGPTGPIGIIAPRTFTEAKTQGNGGDGETLSHSNSLAMISSNNTALDSYFADPYWREMMKVGTLY